MNILIVGSDIGSLALFRALARLTSMDVVIVDEPRQPQPCDMSVVLREFAQHIRTIPFTSRVC